MNEQIDRERLLAAAEICRKMADAFENVAQDFKPFTTACSEQGLNWGNCRRVILSKAFQGCKEDMIPLENAVEISKDPYEFLYSEIFPEWDSETMKLPFDYVESVISVLNDLSDREHRVVCMHCGIDEEDGEGKTFDTIAPTFGVTRERIRQVYVHALRKLRHPVRKRVLSEGLCKYQTEKAISDAEATAWKRVLEEEKEKRIEDALDNAREYYRTNGFHVSVEALDKPISESSLSVRSYSCLKKANINTYEDLIKTSEFDLACIRNLGNKSLNEVLNLKDAILASIPITGNSVGENSSSNN